ncbi:MAG: hypothetical protein AB1472_01490 [Candidatus Omnitrophota bacterium]
MEDQYSLYQDKKLEEYESQCKRCGACCGVFEDDPCQNLILEEDKKYSCKVYDNRFGLQKTMSGKEFLCVPIRKVISQSWAGSWRCSYKNVK